MRMKVIGFCGLPGAGKSASIEIISDLGLVVTMGDVIRNEAKLRNLKPTSDNLGKIAAELREKGGPEIVAEKCVEFIRSKEAEIIFIDGLRSLSEVNVFRKFWKFPIIAIDLDEELRFKRLTERGRSDDPKSIDDLRERDKREINFGVNEVIENADYKIMNGSTKEIVQNKTRELVLRLIQEY